ncbi:unnamed protein product [Rhizophagus irregularis]|nr:unnamed protein product [Rhizophagus irregularis]CAB4434475.1 unnamed protein product [Rhizophagus irregularis]
MVRRGIIDSEREFIRKESSKDEKEKCESSSESYDSTCWKEATGGGANRAFNPVSITSSLAANLAESSEDLPEFNKQL